MSVLDKFSLEGKSGFVTGAAWGIGRDVADAYIEAGANIVVADIRQEEAQKVADMLSEKHNKKVIACACDVTKEEDADKLADLVVKEFGSIEIAVNNAGTGSMDSAMDMPAAEFRRIIDVNLNAVFLTARAAAKKMRELGVQNGSIISTASMSGQIVNFPQKLSAYCASKGGVIMLTKALALEWSEYNIRVNCVSPGYMTTEMLVNMPGFEEFSKVWMPLVPLKRLGCTDDLLGAYIYLASDASKYVTGADYVVDGGYTIL